MPKTNWQDPGSSEVRSTHISGLQEAVGKIEDILDMQLQAETGIGLSEVYISEQDRYRIFQAPEGKRNWASDPAPVIKKNGVPIASGFVIDYGGGAVIFSTPVLGSDTVTADFSRTKTDGNKLAMLDAADVPYDNIESELTATDTQAAIDETVDMVKTHLAETVTHAEVTNKTITVGVGKDFATIQEAVDSLKKRIESNIIIQLDAGEYDETVYIDGFVGKGSITLRGSSDKPGATNYEVNRLYIRQNSILVTIEGLETFTTDIGIAIGRNNYTLVKNCLSENEGNYFVYATGGFVKVENCTASNKSFSAIRTQDASILFSSNNDGTNNNTGLSAILGGTIIKNGTQPTGTTDEATATGGLIR